MVDTVMDNTYSPFLGFTPEEVTSILTDYELSGEREQITAWYNGYKFGNQDIFNPWDIMNYCRDVKINPDMPAKPYWINSSSNEIIRELIDHSDDSLHLELEQLLRGECIYRVIKQEITYDDFGNVDTLWSVLYMTGYLTAELTDTRESAMALKIPNQEIQEIFSKKIYEWSIDKVKTLDCKGFKEALWDKNTEILQQVINQMLLDTISFYDYKEDYYHVFLAGILKTIGGYTVKSNEEMGLGRSDIAVLDDKLKRGIWVEVKHSKSENFLLRDCKTALLQMKEKKYSTYISGLQYDLISYGIACYKKQCLILCDS